MFLSLKILIHTLSSHQSFINQNSWLVMLLNLLSVHQNLLSCIVTQGKEGRITKKTLFL
jgi:hypothetical protein